MLSATEPNPVTSTASQALTHGLEVLKVVSESRSPITSTEIGRRVGLHQSWVSRVLKTLSIAGYVRKPDYHSFAVDYGVLTLAGNSQHQFPFITKPRQTMVDLAEKSDGMNVALAMLWQGQLIYFMRTQKGHETVPLSVGFPLHLSSVSLRLLIDVPAAQAVEALKESKRRYGWERPTDKVPKTPEELLKIVRGLVRHDSLVLDEHLKQGLIGCSIPIEVKNEPRAALAISGPRNLYSIDTILLMLQEGRRAIETLMNASEKKGE
jgi:DNA-binding IclR family transcriptional regulator